MTARSTSSRTGSASSAERPRPIRRSSRPTSSPIPTIAPRDRTSAARSPSRCSTSDELLGHRQLRRHRDEADRAHPRRGRRDAGPLDRGGPPVGPPRRRAPPAPPRHRTRPGGEPWPDGRPGPRPRHGIGRRRGARPARSGRRRIRHSRGRRDVPGRTGHRRTDLSARRGHRTRPGPRRPGRCRHGARREDGRGRRARRTRLADPARGRGQRCPHRDAGSLRSGRSASSSCASPTCW